jgi:hypothetical protein
MSHQIVLLIASGFIGFLGGTAALLAQQHLAWIPQKRIELRRAVFDEAVSALAMYEVDALDVELQSNPQTHDGIHPAPVLRLETKIKMERVRAQVQAFFPAATFEAFTQALNAPVNLKNIPNTDFAEKTSRALKLMAADIGLW